jgi:coproporphyrinogen III oxidase
MAAPASPAPSKSLPEDLQSTTEVEIMNKEDAPTRSRMTAYVQDLQSRIISVFEELDTSVTFKRDKWLRDEGGMGISAVAAGGIVLEKAGVNVSVVHGMLPPAAIKQMRVDHTDIPYDPSSNASLPFFACGISLVIHPRNPHAPTVHANYRYFEITDESLIDSEETTHSDSDKNPEGLPIPHGKILSWWFGGGCDLTPSYLYEEDARTFHGTLKAACDPFGESVYPAFKQWCDEYFYIPHRQESRGIGGIFFDDLSSGPHKRLPEASSPSSSRQPGAELLKRPRSQEDIFAFIRACGDAFIPSYIPILKRRISTPSTEEQRRWQLLRRGRYVEFNLVYDRGTKFGLHTPGARIESILMSLPETARWEYMSDVGADEATEEHKLLLVLKSPRDWVNESPAIH